jgi:hypothetical protein
MSPRCGGCSTARLVDRQPGHRPRPQRAGGGAGLRAASGREVPTAVVPRRPGDVAACYADPALAARCWAGGPARPGPHVRRQLALATTQPPRIRSMKHSRSTRHHGRRLRHPAVAAVARRLPKQFLVLSGNTQPVPAGRGNACRAGRRHASRWQHPLVVGNEEHRFLVLDQLREIWQLEPAAVLLEPHGPQHRAGLTLAALQALEGGADPVLVVTPADQTVTDPAAFTAAHAPRRGRGRGRRHRHPGHRARPARDRLRLHPRRAQRLTAKPWCSDSSRSPTSPPPSATWPKAATSGTPACSC